MYFTACNDTNLYIFCNRTLYAVAYLDYDTEFKLLMWNLFSLIDAHLIVWIIMLVRYLGDELVFCDFCDLIKGV